MPAINIRDIELNDEEVPMKQRQRPHRRIRQETMKVNREQVYNTIAQMPKHKVRKTVEAAKNLSSHATTHTEKEFIVTASAPPAPPEQPKSTETTIGATETGTTQETPPIQETTMKTEDIQVETKKVETRTIPLGNGEMVIEKIGDEEAKVSYRSHDIVATPSVEDYHLKTLLLSSTTSELVRRSLLNSLFLHLRKTNKGLLYTSDEGAICLSGVIDNELVGITAAPSPEADGGVSIALNFRNPMAAFNVHKDHFPEMETQNLSVANALTVIEKFTGGKSKGE